MMSRDARAGGGFCLKFIYFREPELTFLRGAGGWLAGITIQSNAAGVFSFFFSHPNQLEFINKHNN
jgi:hypothetical protein